MAPSGALTSYKKHAALLFAALYGVVLIKGLKGIGIYWDWSFPYFSNHLPQYLLSHSNSWTSVDFGSPLSYSSNFFIRALISSLGVAHIPPEVLLYLLLVMLFSLGSLAIWLLARERLGSFKGLLLSSAVFLNPAFLYKLQAGHFDYYFSFVIFLYLIVFLFLIYKKTLQNNIILILLVALSGMQIQFFVFSFLLISLFSIFFPEKLNWRLLPVVAFAVFVINLPWLMNFLDGANSAAKVSALAASHLSLTSGTSNIIQQLYLAFSSGTHIDKIYAPLVLMTFTSLWVLALASAIRTQNNKSKILWLTVLVILMLSSTGLLNSIPFPPFSFLSPMFREVGHFGPLICLSLILIIVFSETKPQDNRAPGDREQKLFWTSAPAILVVFVAINAVAIATYLPTTDYSKARAAFREFEDFRSIQRQKENWQKENYRVLSYPFFSQFQFKWSPVKLSSDAFPLNNVGYDNYLKYAGFDYVNNALADDLKKSPQYMLLKSYDLKILKPYNVKYLFDFSDIYESHLEKYISGDEYDYNLTLIKNTQGFLKQLSAKNPGQLKQISPHIYEILDAGERVQIAKQVVDVGSSEDAMTKLRLINSLAGIAFYTTEDQSQDSQNAIRPLFDAYGNTSSEASALLDSNTQGVSLAVSNNAYEIRYKYEVDGVHIYLDPGIAPSQEPRQKTVQSLLKLPLPGKNTRYFARIASGDLVELSGRGTKVGYGKAGDDIKFYKTTGANLIANPSFEEGPWSKFAESCGSPGVGSAGIGMKVIKGAAYDGENYLELNANAQTGCTDVDFAVKPNSLYALGLSYSSQNAPSARYGLEFKANDKDTIAETLPIYNSSWHRASRLIDTFGANNGRGRLHLYAIGGQGRELANYYDALELTELQITKQSILPTSENAFTQYAVSPGVARALYADTSDQANLIANGDFERGPWVVQPNCYGPARPDMAKIETVNEAEGLALVLGSSTSQACASTDFNFHAGGNYIFSFSYRGKPSKPLTYEIQFDNPRKTRTTKRIITTDDNWHNYRINLPTPSDASSGTIRLFGYKLDNKKAVAGAYANLKVVPNLDLQNRFYVTHLNNSPDIGASVSSTSFGTTKKNISIKNAKANTTLIITETYNKNWRVALAGKASDYFAQHHHVINDFENGWYIDVDRLCRQQKLCTQNADGSYNLEMVAEFMPQHWFYLGLIVSGATLMGCLGYLGWSWQRGRLAAASTAAQ